jgi:type IV pilus assembly protein PilW
MSTSSPMGSKRAHGLTLVELMVAITVALILMAGVIQLFVGNKQAYRLQEGAALLNENARFARQQLEYALRMAGHWGGALPSETQPAPVGDTGTLGCAGAPVYQAAIGAMIGLEGFESTGTAAGGSGNAPPLDCALSDYGYRPGTDVLAVRYAGDARLCMAAATEEACVAALETTDGGIPVLVRTRVGAGKSEIFRATDAGTLYASSGSTANAALRFAAAAGDTLTNPDLTATHRFHYEIYFVTHCGTRRGAARIDCSVRQNPTPTLARLRLEGQALVAEDLVEGVEALEMRFGLDDNGDYAPDRFLDATALRSADALGLDAAAGTKALWNRVVAVRVGLLIRNPQRDMARMATAPATFRLPGREITVSGDELAFPRKAVVFTVQTRNTLRNLR